MTSLAVRDECRGHLRVLVISLGIGVGAARNDGMAACLQPSRLAELHVNSVLTATFPVRDWQWHSTISPTLLQALSLHENLRDGSNVTNHRNVQTRNLRNR